jgi:hypothetical protein
MRYLPRASDCGECDLLGYKIPPDRFLDVSRDRNLLDALATTTGIAFGRHWFHSAVRAGEERRTTFADGSPNPVTDASVEADDRSDNMPIPRQQQLDRLGLIGSLVRARACCPVHCWSSPSEPSQ